MSDYVILHWPKVKTDLTIYSTGRVVLSARLARRLKADSGDGLVLVGAHNGEMLLGVSKNTTEDIICRLQRTSYKGCTMCANSVKLAKLILGDDGVSVGRYRCGEVVNVLGREFVSIITRRNYADKADRAEGDKP